MVLEISGSTVLGQNGEEGAVELFNVWDSIPGDWSWITTGGASYTINKGHVNVRLNSVTPQGTATYNNSGILETPDLIPLLSKTNLSFNATVFGGGICDGLGNSPGGGGQGLIYINNGITNIATLLQGAGWIVTYGTSDSTAGSGGGAYGFANANINLSLNGTQLTISIIGYGFDGNTLINPNSGFSITAGTGSAHSVLTDQTIVTINPDEALKIRVQVSEYGGVHQIDIPPGAIATISPIVMINSKFGSKKTVI